MLMELAQDGRRVAGDDDVEAFLGVVTATWIPEFARPELFGRPFVEFVHPDDRDDTEVESGEISVAGPTHRSLSEPLPGQVRWAPLARVDIGRGLEQELEQRSGMGPLPG